MGFLRQVTTLTWKNLRILLLRSLFFTPIRAFIAPVIYMFFISYAKNFFVPPSNYGIGSPVSVRSLDNALGASAGGRNTVVFVNNGHTGGAIGTVIDRLSTTVQDAGKTARIVSDPVDVLSICPSSLRGVTTCFGAVDFISSPNEGPSGLWNYTLRADTDFGTEVFVDETNNDAEIYILPLQRAIDAEITQLEGNEFPSATREYPFTSETNEQRARNITSLFMDSIINVLADAYFLAVVGVVYHLVGFMATERETGLSQLIEAMTPNEKQWHTQAARLGALHVSFLVLYGPAWILMSFPQWRLVFPTSSFGIVITLNILAGLSLTSFSIFGGAFFRKAQLSGISVTIISVVLAIIAQVAGPSSSAGIVILSLLFPPMAYTFAIIFLAHWEKEHLAADLVQGAPGSSWQMPGIALWIILIIHTLIFPLLGAAIERRMHGTTKHNTRKMILDNADSTDSVVLSDFSKHYAPSWWRQNVFSRLGASKRDTVTAVNNLSFTALRGQITVLLGANGSGKSTTLDAIAGLSPITHGAIQVDGTGGVGLCPQKNVLWDKLTVFEHVRIFNELKSTNKPDNHDEVRKLISDCDLDLKMNAKAGTLSGGQKRKLQLAMMFTGGSHVCLVDEMSSGLDPLSRKKIQQIILRERGRRTLLLTTHFLDEADVLSDQIVILSKGYLKAEGTAVHLKNIYGGGYRLQVLGPIADLPSDFKDLKILKQNEDRTIYQLAGSSEASHYVKLLDQSGGANYQVFGPTVEDVFLKLAEEIRTGGQDHEENQRQVIDSLKESSQGELSDSPAGSSPKNSLDSNSGLLTGVGTSMVQQTWILFRKRLTILRRNYLPYLAALLIPIIASGLVTLFLKGFTSLSCSLENQNSDPTTFNLANPIISHFSRVVMGPSDRVPIKQIAKLYRLSPANITTVETLSDFNEAISNNFSDITPGGIFNDGSGSPLFAWRANWGIESAPMVQNLLDNVIGSSLISTNYQAFAVPFAPNTGDSLQLVLYFGLAMAIYPGFFALYVTMERLRNVRALHYSNGIRSAPLWTAYMLFDSIFVVVVSAVTIGIFVGAWNGWWAPGYLFLVFLFYGLTSIVIVYIISLFVTSQLAAFAIAAGMQAVELAVYFAMYLSIITYIPAADIDRDLELGHYLYSLIAPTGSLMRGMFLALNEFSISCDGRRFASYPGGILYYGGPILYLIVQGIIGFGVLLWIDSGWRPGFLIRTGRVEDNEEADTQEPEVRQEMGRVEQSEDGLRVMHLYKSFSRNQVVQNITFGVSKGEVFALLGPNGAGKSTTISLVRGDLRPTGDRGDVMIEGNSIKHHRATARRHLGVCPQFDAMDQMTVLEHLRFYAQVRGVPDAEHNVARVVTAVGLDAFTSRLAAKLSGGNKRKLSLAIAIMGNPSVLILDEPSSGQDAAAKRVMWRTLQAITPGRSLLITTHSMEEADALADRAGIMARKMLALGSVDRLRATYGNAYNVHLVHNKAPHTTAEDATALRDWVVENVPGAITEDRIYHGQLRFTVPIAAQNDNDSSSTSRNDDAKGKGTTKEAVSISELFQLLETHKEEAGIAYYSVSETTLEQIFLTIVGRHNVEEEGHSREQGGKRGWLELFAKGFRKHG